MHTRTSAIAAGATLLLAVLQLFWAVARAHSDIAGGTAAFLSVVTVLAGLALARTPVFEARLAVGLVCGAQIGLMLLAITLGLPGADRQPIDPHVVVALVVPLGILTLLEIDRRARHERARPTPPASYAL